MDKEGFLQALEKDSVELLKRIPKSDLHSHAGRGGSISYIAAYQAHQIRTLFDYGVPVTINTDDLLIFDSSVSQEYLKLFQADLMNAEELNLIRETGLKPPRKRSE